MTRKKEIEETQKKNETSELTQRLALASVEGLVVSAAVNAIIPGAGLAVNSLKGVKGIKKVAKVVGKSSAKEGVKMLDNTPESEDKLEDLSEDFALEMIDRSLGR